MEEKVYCLKIKMDLIFNAKFEDVKKFHLIKMMVPENLYIATQESSSLEKNRNSDFMTIGVTNPLHLCLSYNTSFYSKQNANFYTKKCRQLLLS